MDDRLRDILILLARTPSADNSQPWRFETGSSYIICHSLSESATHDPFGPVGHATLMSAGAMHESINLLFGKESKTTATLGDSQWQIRLDYTHLPDPSNEVAKRLLMRHTNRFPYARCAVDWPSLPEPSPYGARVLPITDRSVIEIAGEAVKICSAARFNTQELHEWLFSSIRWNNAEASQGNGLDIATLNLPPGGRHFMRFITPWSRMLFLNRLGAYRIMAAADARPIHDASALVAIVGGKSQQSIWKAGRLMMSTWLALNDAGLGVHPYYVVTDISNRIATDKLDSFWLPKVKKTLADLNESLGIGTDKQIHILLRIGTPQKVAARSARIPIEQLLTA